MRFRGRRRAATDQEPLDDWPYLDDVGDAFAFAAAPAQEVLAVGLSALPYCFVDAQAPGPWTAIEMASPADGDSGTALADALQARVLGIWTDGWLLGLRLWRPGEPVLAWLGRPVQDLPDGRTPAEVAALTEWVSLAGLATGDGMAPLVQAVLEWLDDVEGDDFGVFEVLDLPVPDLDLPVRSVVLTQGWAPRASLPPLMATGAGTAVLSSRLGDWSLFTTLDCEGHELKWGYELRREVTICAGKGDITFEFRLDGRELVLTISRGRKVFHTVRLATPWVERGGIDLPEDGESSLLYDANALHIEVSILDDLQRLSRDHLSREEALARAVTILKLPQEVAVAAWEPERFAQHENVSVDHPRSFWRQWASSLWDPNGRRSR